MNSNDSSTAIGCVLLATCLLCSAAGLVGMNTYLGPAPQKHPLAPMIDGYFDSVNDEDYAGAVEFLCAMDPHASTREQTATFVQRVRDSGETLEYTFGSVEMLPLSPGYFTTFSLIIVFPTESLQECVSITIKELYWEQCIHRIKLSSTR